MYRICCRVSEIISCKYITKIQRVFVNDTELPDSEFLSPYSESETALDITRDLVSVIHKYQGRV